MLLKIGRSGFDFEDFCPRFFIEFQFFSEWRGSACMLSSTALLCQRSHKPFSKALYIEGSLPTRLYAFAFQSVRMNLRATPFKVALSIRELFCSRASACEAAFRPQAWPLCQASLGCGGSGNSVLMALDVSARRFCWNSLTQLLTVLTISRADSCALFFGATFSSTCSSTRLLSLRLIIFIGAFFVIMTFTFSPNDCFLFG